MVNINLLPWRERRGQFHREMFKQLFCYTLVISFVILIVLHLWFSYVLQEKNQYIENLQQQFAAKKMRHDVANEQAHTQTSIETFLHQHQRIIALLNDIVYLRHSEICFRKIIARDNTITLYGKAISFLTLTRQFKNWQTIYSKITILGLRQIDNTTEFKIFLS